MGESSHCQEDQADRKTQERSKSLEEIKVPDKRREEETSKRKIAQKESQLSLWAAILCNREARLLQPSSDVAQH